MKTKKILALLLALVMVFAFVAACADDPVVVDPEDPPAPPEETPAPTDPTDPTDPEDPEEPGRQYGGVLTVAVNLMNADVLGGWTNPVGNSQMRELTGIGSSTIAWTRNSEFIVNPSVVAEFDGPVVNDDDSRTWTITIQDNLRWSDGTPITAVDYVFSFLFAGAPAFASAGTPDANLGNTSWVGFQETTGFMDYVAGETDYISGVRLLGDFTFSVTIDAYTAGAPNFPYFYELTYADVGPSPIHVIAPGLTVEDNGDGVTMSGDGLTYELLRVTVDDGVDGGIRYNPAPSAGPYFLAAPVDLEAETIVVQRNPYFHGTYDGTKPAIETIILRRVDNAVLIPALQVGDIDLMVGAAGAAVIPPGLAMVEEGGFGYIAMPRNGSGGLFFHWDVGPTQFVEVRRAIAWTLDRVEFNNMWAAGHASTNDSLIAVASWMYQENRDAIPGLITYNYTINTANATAELEAGGWVYNEAGEEWQPGDGPRHKDVDGELMPLVLRWASPEANDIGAMLSSLMTEPANSIGMYFDQTWVDGPAFSNALTGMEPDNRFNMINGGLGLNPINAFWFQYSPNPDLWGSWNWTRTDDEILYGYARGMRNSSSREEYLENWMGFIARFNVVLPALPLNADTFHDFYREGLMEYYRNDLFSWSRAIVWAHLDLENW